MPTRFERWMRSKLSAITARSRIDTPEELNYFKHGGILPYVLRNLAK